MQSNQSADRVPPQPVESAGSPPGLEVRHESAKPPTGFSKRDIAFMAYFPAVAASVAAMLVLSGPPYPSPFEFFSMLLLSGFTLLIPFVLAAISLRIVPVILPDWQFKRPLAGGALGIALSFGGTLLFFSLLGWVGAAI